MSRRYTLQIMCIVAACAWQLNAAQLTYAQAAPSQRANLGTLTQAHHFAAKELAPSDAVLLYGIFPIMIAGNAALLTGNIVALVRGKQRKTWGGAGLVVGILSAIGGSALLADEGVGWVMLPVSVSTVLLTLSITNLALGDKPTPPKPVPAQGGASKVMGHWR